MSTSIVKTSTTTNWILEKYSRSRPSPSSSSHNDPSSSSNEPSASKKLKPNPSSTTGTTEVVEWDHYSQPQIHLSLEVITSPSPNSHSNGTQTHSMNLRISHSPLPSNNTTSSASSSSSPLTGSHTLESLDLTSFSHSPPILTCTPLDQLPLKAVYKNTCVGLRYISISHSDYFELGKGKRSRIEWKRFQIKFKSKQEAKVFVEILGKVCAVKLAEVQVGTTGGGGVGSGSTTGTRTETGSVTTEGGERNHLPDQPQPQPQRHPPSAHQLLPNPVSAPSPFYPPPITLQYNQRLPLPQSLPSPLPPSTLTKIPNFDFLLPPLTNATHSNQLPPPPLNPFPNFDTSYQQEQYPFYNHTGVEAVRSSRGRGCSELTNLPPSEFDNLLEQVLFDDGFEGLVERIRTSLKGKM